MENETTTTTPTIPPSSDQAVSKTMQKGFEKMIVSTTFGLVVGGMAGIVLARGGRATSARKILAGTGAGIGLGSSWTKCSMELEDLLSSTSSSK